MQVTVLGAGIIGVSTAWHLLQRGHSVTLVDAYGPGNARATSGGETRQIRVGYGDREVYSRWVLRGMELRREREREAPGAVRPRVPAAVQHVRPVRGQRAEPLRAQERPRPPAVTAPSTMPAFSWLRVALATSSWNSLRPSTTVSVTAALASTT